MSDTSSTDSLSLLGDLVARAKRAGADAAEAVLVDSASLSVEWRQDTLDKLERAESGDIGLRVLIGKRQALVSSSDRSGPALAELIDRAVAMAKAVPEDPFIGLAEPAQLATTFPELDLFDPTEPTADQLLDMVRTGEAVALDVKGVAKSGGSGASWGKSNSAFVASNGFARTYQVSSFSIGISVVAGEDKDNMESGGESSSTVYFSDLKTPQEIGRIAGERAVEHLSPRKVQTCKVPMIFDPRASRGLISSFSGVINGAAVARGTTFLKDSLGKAVFARGIRIIDDPHRMRGLRSRGSDAEGLPTTARDIVSDGILTTWFLDLRSARQLGMAPTGHASRGTASPPSPSPSNLYLDGGVLTRGELLSDVANGFYVTQLSGSGVNPVTGDYSRGAKGFWIENGELTYPVSEVTVAGNLKDMFLNLTPANDLELLHGIDAPTVRIDGLTLAGK